MVADKQYGHQVLRYPKAHSWKTLLHSIEHDFKTVSPYMFLANLMAADNGEDPDFMPDGNKSYKVTFDSLH